MGRVASLPLAFEDREEIFVATAASSTRSIYSKDGEIRWMRSSNCCKAEEDGLFVDSCRWSRERDLFESCSSLPIDRAPKWLIERGREERCW